MYLLVDRQKMCFVASAAGPQELAALAVADNHIAADIFPQGDKRCYSVFSELELKLLHRNTTGADPELPWQPEAAYSALVNACYELGLAVEKDPRSAGMLERLAAKALPGETQDSPLNQRVSGGKKASPSQPRAKAVAGPITRPKAGSATGRVWELADKMLAAEVAACRIRDGEGNPLFSWKSLRADIITACVEEGINPATAQVQFGKWKGSKQEG